MAINIVVCANPFALVHPKQHIRSHASFLRNVFAAIFPMEASMPFLVEQAIVRAYEEKGWDLTDNTCFCCDDPFSLRRMLGQPWEI